MFLGFRLLTFSPPTLLVLMTWDCNLFIMLFSLGGFPAVYMSAVSNGWNRKGFWGSLTFLKDAGLKRAGFQFAGRIIPFAYVKHSIAGVHSSASSLLSSFPRPSSLMCQVPCNDVDPAACYNTTGAESLLLEETLSLEPRP